MFEMKLPKIKGNEEESLVVIWFVSPGNAVKKGDRLLKVQTEKEVMEIESERDGIIKEIKVKRGESAKAGEVLALIREDGNEKEPEEQNMAEIASEPEKMEKKPGAKRKNQKQEEKELIENVGKPLETSAYAVPSVASRLQKIARDLGVDLENIQGTGRNGKITEEDIRKIQKETAQKRTTQEANEADETKARETANIPEASGTLKAETAEGIVPLSGTRAIIPPQMAKSLQQSAKLTEMAWADVTKLETKKEKLGQDIGWTALFGKAVAQALQNHPALNAHISESSIQSKQTIDLGFAIDTDNGLRVAVIPQAEASSTVELHQKLGELAEKARGGKLSKEESSGSSFTITSLGGHSVQFFTPIINPPETAILGIGKIEDYLVMDGRKVRVRRRVPLSLTVDHRAIDGAPAAQFLDELISLLEKPKRFLEKKQK